MESFELAPPPQAVNHHTLAHHTAVLKTDRESIGDIPHGTGRASP